MTSKEGFGIEVDFSLPDGRAIRCLERIIEWRGKLLEWVEKPRIAISNTPSLANRNRTPETSTTTAFAIEFEPVVPSVTHLDMSGSTFHHRKHPEGPILRPASAFVWSNDHLDTGTGDVTHAQKPKGAI